MASKELFHLLRVLDERDTGLGRDDVAWAFEPAKKAETEEWVKTYLTPATLLTKEEHAFHDRFGEFTPQIHSAASGRPLSDEEFEHAINSLESSTAAIDAQCQLLEAQKRALLDFKARNSSGDQQGHAEPSKRRQTVTREKAQLDLELSQLSSSLKERLRSSMTQTEAALTNFPTKVERLLEKDDRMLDGLQKVIPKLSGDNNDGNSLQEVDQLCQAFTIIEAKAIRAKIDALYQDHQSDQSKATNGYSPSDGKEQQSVRAELEELSSEIDGLLTLVVENYYRIPITKRLGNAQSESRNEAARWSEYLGSTLTYLSSRLESLTQHFQHLHTHRAALDAISQTLQKAIAAPPAKAEEAQPAAAKTAQAQKGLKPLRLVQANLPEAPDATAQLLRHLDIKHSDLTDVAKLSQTLQSAKLERQNNLVSFTSSTDASLRRQLGESLNRADVDARDLLSAVFAHSQFGERRLTDEEAQRELDVLEGRTQTIGEQMRRLDVEGLAGDVRRLQRNFLAQEK